MGEKGKNKNKTEKTFKFPFCRAQKLEVVTMINPRTCCFSCLLIAIVVCIHWSYMLSARAHLTGWRAVKT